MHFSRGNSEPVTVKSIVGVIPARGGSVGVPLKNIKLLGGKPLISYTIEAAIESKVLDRLIVSTDHDEIARVAESYGAEVPFRRPADISEDVETELVLQHAVTYLETEERYAVGAVALLQPTSPFRTAETIRRCVQAYRESREADSIVTANNVEGHRPEWMLTLSEDGRVIPYATPFTVNGDPVIKLVARQSLPVLFRQNGVVYVTERNLLMNRNLVIGPNAYAVVTDEREAIDIDTETDFLIAEALVQVDPDD